VPHAAKDAPRQQWSVTATDHVGELKR
jgi:hypothetical protein